MSVIEEPAPPEQAEVTMSAPVGFEAFFRREYRSMVALAAVITGSSDVAEDVAQEAMLRARRHWDRISEYDTPGTWLRRVTINLARSNRQRLALEARVRLAWWDRREAREEPEAIDPELLTALRTLPRQQRAAVALHYLEDRSTSEIAVLLGCSEPTARVHLHRGRRALAIHLGAAR
jgi:RNA polymerase sigma-70 factor (ECF subfamily)